MRLSSSNPESYAARSTNLLFPLALAAVTLLGCEVEDLPPPETYSCTPIPAEQLIHPLADQFQRLLEADLPFTTGVQVAVTDARGERWTGAAGYADIGAGVQYTPCMRGAVASITKTVTAALILEAQDNSLVDIDSPVGDYLDAALLTDLANASEATLRQLLSHTSGIPDYLTLRQTLDSFNEPFLRFSQEDKLEYARGIEAIHPVGSAFSYSNTNYLLLGLVLERVYGLDLTEVFEARVSLPLQLGGFVMGTENDPIPDDIPRPYLALAGGKFQNVISSAVSDAATGDGGVLTNMTELEVFAKALFSGELVSDAMLAEMTAEVSVLSPEQSDFDFYPNEAYGLGLTRYNTPIGVAYGHTGSTSAYNSTLLYFPATGVNFAIIRNGIDLERVDASIEQSQRTMDAFLELLQ